MLCLVDPEQMGKAMKTLLDMDVCILFNSDDPAYFGGYINDCYHLVAGLLSLSPEAIVKVRLTCIT